MALKVEVRGVKELGIKLTRFSNLLGTEYNKAAKRYIGEYGKKRFRAHIDKHQGISGPFIDLSDKYKIEKQKRWGKIYPILRASDKMYRDLMWKFTPRRQIGRGINRIQVEWGFKTKRSEKLANIHAIQGIKRKFGGMLMRVRRDPFFLNKGEQIWIKRKFNEATKIARRKARLA